jgi:hypothetical protein
LDQLGVIWAHFGVLLEQFGVVLDKLGVVWDNVGVILDNFGNTNAQKYLIFSSKTRKIRVYYTNCPLHHCRGSDLKLPTAQRN